MLSHIFSEILTIGFQGLMALGRFLFLGLLWRRTTVSFSKQEGI